MPEPRFQARDRRQSSGRLLAALAASLSIHASVVVLVGGRGPALPPAARAVIVARLVPARGASPSPPGPNIPVPAEKPNDPKRQAATKIGIKDVRPQPALVNQVSAATPEVVRVSEPVVELPLPFDPTYYPAKQLDVTPKPLGDPRCPCPDGAGNLLGRLVLQAMIDETGRVTEVSVEQSDPPGVFDEACIAHYRTLRFTPGMKDGRPARSKSRFELVFGGVEPPESPERKGGEDARPGD